MYKVVGQRNERKPNAHVIYVADKYKLYVQVTVMSFTEVMRNSAVPT